MLAGCGLLLELDSNLMIGLGIVGRRGACVMVVRRVVEEVI
jgi:hypothetical protein